MSVQINQYAGFGFFLNHKEAIKALEAKYDEDKIEDIFDKYHDSAYDQKIVEVNGFSMIDDGMSGEYTFFGKIDQKSQCDCPLNLYVYKSPSAKVKKLLNEEIINVFGTDFGLKPACIVFAHYR